MEISQQCRRSQLKKVYYVDLASKTMTLFLLDDERDWRHCRLPGGIILQRHNTDMQEDCNTCTCANGTRTCTKIVCGTPNCWNHTQAGGCPTGGVCVPKKAVDCLSPPCGRWAECKGGATNSKQSDSGIGDEVCLPNSTDLNGDCAKIHIVFSRSKLPTVSKCTWVNCESVHVPLLRFSHHHHYQIGLLFNDCKIILDFPINRELSWKNFATS